jgi:mercuric ion transport protein
LTPYYGTDSRLRAMEQVHSPMVAPTVRRSLVAGALAAIGASVCCVGPLVLLMLGIGGTWVANLTALEPLRPWLIGATLLFLGLAYRRLYLQPQVCEPGAACAEPIVLRRQRWVFWIVALALFALLTVPSVAPYFL